MAIILTVERVHLHQREKTDHLSEREREAGMGGKDYREVGMSSLCLINTVIMNMNFDEYSEFSLGT